VKEEGGVRNAAKCIDRKKEGRLLYKSLIHVQSGLAERREGERLKEREERERERGRWKEEGERRENRLTQELRHKEQLLTRQNTLLGQRLAPFFRRLYRYRSVRWLSGSLKLMSLGDLRPKFWVGE